MFDSSILAKRICPGVIVTDLDGTLLSSAYDIGPAATALRRADRLGVPVCVCSSKTRAEIERINQSLDIRDPFISENGGAIHIPENYFEMFPDRVLQRPARYTTIMLGRPYSDLTAELRRITTESGVVAHSFHERTAKEVADETGLPLLEAGLALDRHYDLPFRLDRREHAGLLKALVGSGFAITEGGRYFHLTGLIDKGRAVAQLLGMFSAKQPGLRSAAIGDSENDAPMLKQAELAIVVQKSGGVYDAEVLRQAPFARKAKGVGPEGWNTSVHELLNEWVHES